MIDLPVLYPGLGVVQYLGPGLHDLVLVCQCPLNASGRHRSIASLYVKTTFITLPLPFILVVCSLIFNIDDQNGLPHLMVCYKFTCSLIAVLEEWQLTESTVVYYHYSYTYSGRLLHDTMYVRAAPRYPGPLPTEMD